jgi:hypothetical protein
MLECAVYFKELSSTLIALLAIMLYYCLKEMRTRQRDFNAISNACKIDLCICNNTLTHCRGIYNVIYAIEALET